MIETLLLSITSFAATNIDDIFINTLFFSESKTKSDRKNIFIGKYFGIGTLILLSILGAFGLHFLPQHYIGYLGIVPIFLGIKEAVNGMKQKTAAPHHDTDEIPACTGDISVIGCVYFIIQTIIKNHTMLSKH